jgi:hypothetical protein
MPHHDAVNDSVERGLYWLEGLSSWTLEVADVPDPLQ